jgi:hypothetical protein
MVSKRLHNEFRKIGSSYLRGAIKSKSRRVWVKTTIILRYYIRCPDTGRVRNFAAANKEKQPAIIFLPLWQLEAGQESGPLVPYKEVWVEPGKRHRLRFVAGLCTVCGVEVSIEGHGMTLIATDGSPVVPVDITSVDLFSGTNSLLNLSSTNCNEDWPSPVNALRCTSSPRRSIRWVPNRTKV